ncbi:MAG: DedA family protein [Acidobacteria bacterium]|jgi:membrane-associated protein|nr:DedA family protein [Acidobacteriota bacterium]
MWAYLVMSFAACVKYLVPLVPGDAALLGSVFFVGVHHGSWLLAITLITAGGTVGALCAYLWGRRFGGLLLKNKKMAGVAEKVQALLGRWGVWPLVLNRFVPYARTLFFPVAGLLRLPSWPVSLAAVAGNFLFAAFLAALGYSAGRGYGEIATLYHFYQVWLGAAAVVMLLGLFAYALWFRSLLSKKTSGGAG